MLLELKEIKFLVPVKFYRNVVLNKLINFISLLPLCFIYFFISVPLKWDELHN